MVKFLKYHGCGNDFIVCEHQDNINYPELTRNICNRYTGIGADTFIEIDSKNKKIRFYNADGSVAPMCGNGIRCAAAYLKQYGGVVSEEVDIITDSGVRKVYYKENNLYSINMGFPSFNKEDIDLDYEKDILFNEDFEYNNKIYNLNALFFTTHHLVIQVDDLNISDDVGEYFCKHPMFKKMINVDFVKIIDENTIIQKTYERGCGWTKACGSGATSSVCVFQKKGLLKETVKVIFEYGELIISKQNDGYYMMGPAVKIAENINYNFNK